MVAFTKSGLTLIELSHVPVRTVSGIGRIDVIDGNMIFTVYLRQPADDGEEEAVVIDKISFRTDVIPDEIQFALSVLAQVGVRVLSRKPPALAH